MSINFILFLDPETRYFYSYSYDVGIILRQTPPENIKNRIAKQLDQLELLTDVKTWNKLNSFQKRPIPMHFLKQRKYRYPVYITQQHFPQVLCDIIDVKKEGGIMMVDKKFSDKIKLAINLGDIYKQLKQQVRGKVPKTIQQQAKLLLSANEIMRIISRLILQRYDTIVITKQQNTKFIFKVAGVQEYIYGNEPLMNFQIVRECLRNEQQLKLQIIQNNIDVDEQFKKYIFERKQQDIKNHIYEPFPWQNLKDPQSIDFLLWYKPDLYFLSISQQVALQQKTKDPNHKKQQIQKNKQQINLNIQKQKQKMKDKVLRYTWKQQMHDFLEYRSKQIENGEVQIRNTFIYTGQCCYLFAFDIVGVINLYKILEEKHSSSFEKKLSKRNFLKFTGRQIGEVYMPKQLPCAYSRNKWLEKRIEGRQPYLFSISTQFYFNGKPFFCSPESKPVILEKSPVFKETVVWDVLAKLMMQTSIIFKLSIYSKQGDGEVVGAGVLKIFDEYGFLKQGEQYIQIFNIDLLNEKKIGCMDQVVSQGVNMTTLKIQLPIYKCPVRWSLCDQNCLKNLGYLPLRTISIEKIEQKAQSKKLQTIQQVLNMINYDPLRLLIDKNQPEKKAEIEHFRNVLRNNTNQYRHLPDKLKYYLYSVDWHDVDQINQAYKELEKWAPLTPLDGLLMLTPQISDEKARLHAIKALQQMPDHDILLYSNQITQALVSFETHLNPLIEFIIQKSVDSPFTIAHQFYWQFKNKTSDFITSYRFKMYVEALMMCCPIRHTFVKQVQVNKILINNNMKFVELVSQMKQHQQRKKPFEQMIPVIAKQLQKRKTFIFPVRPKATLNHVLIQKCKLFDSKKFPFMLVCSQRNQYEKYQISPYKVMFKYNDDIKQDNLILKMFKVFNNFWLEEGLDFKMIIYNVLPSGDNVGFIQIVDNCASWHFVHESDPNKSLLNRRQSTYNYIKYHNKQQQNLKKACENFFLSCAGFLVAAYVLGIADRHSGNILIKENGKMFHIDFGNILGRFKKFGPYERQNQSFVFTQEFAYIIGEAGSTSFLNFQSICAKAFNVLRKNGSTIINLLMMMVPAQLPQLKAYENLAYVIKKLNLMESDSQAADRIKADIKRTLDSISRQVDNFMHEKKRNN